MLNYTSKTAIILNSNLNKIQNKSIEEIIRMCIISSEKDDIDNKSDVQTALFSFIKTKISDSNIKKLTPPTISASVLADILILNDVYNNEAKNINTCYTRLCNVNLFQSIWATESAELQAKIPTESVDKFTILEDNLSEVDATYIIDRLYANTDFDYSEIKPVLKLMAETYLNKIQNIAINIQKKAYDFISTEFPSLTENNVFIASTDTETIGSPTNVLFAIENQLTKFFLIDKQKNNEVQVLLNTVYNSLNQESLILRVVLSQENITELEEMLHLNNLFTHIKFVNYNKKGEDSYTQIDTNTIIKFMEILFVEGE